MCTSFGSGDGSMRIQDGFDTRRTFATTLDFIERIDRAANEQSIVDELSIVAARYGLSHMLGGFVPLTRRDAVDLSRSILIINWPQEWAHRYIEQEYALADPVITRLASLPEFLLWRDCFDAQPRLGTAARIRHEAASCGLVDGVAVPFVTMEGHAAAISFGGRHVDLADDGSKVLPLVTCFALGRLLRLRASRENAAEVGLTPRERECLAWAANGKTQWEISVILGVSESTAEKHLLHARVKLGAATRAQAIAEALRMQLIT
jgi:LuxR family transcriptional regulator, quorum-sensing system regulator BjaR1